MKIYENIVGMIPIPFKHQPLTYLNFLYDTVSGYDVAEDDVLSVQPVRLGCRHKELRAIGS